MENHVTTCVSIEFDALLKPNTNFPPGSIRLNVTATKKSYYSTITFFYSIISLDRHTLAAQFIFTQYTLNSKQQMQYTGSILEGHEFSYEIIRITITVNELAFLMVMCSDGCK